MFSVVFALAFQIPYQTRTKLKPHKNVAIKPIVYVYYSKIIIFEPSPAPPPKSEDCLSKIEPFFANKTT